MDILTALLSVLGGLGTAVNVLSGLVQFWITLWGVLSPLIATLLA